MSQQIQCPACNRRFQALDDLTGKTVECGACDHRFSVGLEHVVEEKRKFYPGEHSNAGLDRFGRSQVRDDVPVNFQTASYSHQVDASAVQPASPTQSVSVFTGLSIILAFAILFILTTGKDQAFTDVDMFRRMTLGGFISFVGSALIIFGAKNWRNRAFFLSAVLSVGVMCLVFLRPVHLTPSGAQAGVTDPSGASVSPRVELDEQSEEEEYLSKIGYSKVVEFIRRNNDSEKGVDGRQRVIGIYAHPVTDSSYLTIESFVRRRLSLGRDVPIYRYKRNDNKDSLIVIAGTRLNFDVIAGVCERLGNVASLPSRRIVDLSVNKTVFSDPSPEENRKLTEEDHELFCISNLNELDHPDIDRVISAVQRLGKISDGVKMRYKPKIASRLASLIATEKDDKLLNAVGSALLKWGKDDPSIVKNLTTSTLEQLEAGKPVPRSLVNFLIQNKSDKSLYIVDRMWAENPSRWSEPYIALGAAGEDRLIYHLQNSPIELRNHAVVLLKRVGTKKSIPILKSVLSGKNDGFDISVNRAIDSINAR